MNVRWIEIRGCCNFFVLYLHCFVLLPLLLINELYFPGKGMDASPKRISLCKATFVVEVEVYAEGKFRIICLVYAKEKPNSQQCSNEKKMK